MEPRIEIASIEPSDLKELTAVMTRAFDDDSRRHLGEERGGPEGYDDGSFLRRWCLHPAARCYVARAQRALVGAINVFPGADGEGASVLGCMFVEPAAQRCGLGRSLWLHAQAAHPSRRWRLETPAWATSNHSFYERSCGFRKLRETDPRDPRENLFIYVWEAPSMACPEREA